MKIYQKASVPQLMRPYYTPTIIGPRPNLTRNKMSEHIIKLNDFQHTRKRIDMYFGSRDPHSQIVMTYPEGVADLTEITWTPAAFTMFREILDNALDEVVGHGFGDKVDVTYDAENLVFSVEDNGRGIPLTFSEEHQMHMATLALSNARAGRNFEVRGQVAGTNGIGASGVNFCSEYFKLEIERDGQSFSQLFQEGADNLIVNDPVIKKKPTPKTGTKVTFKISKNVFKNLILPEQFLKDRLYEVAICNPKVKVSYNGERIVVKSVEKNLFSGYKPITIEVKEGTFKSDFWLVPEFFESGEHQHSIVNNIPAFDGGVHIDAFKRSFFSGLLDALSKESKKRKLQPNRSDVAEGLMIFNITRMEAPNFNSQAKTRLNNEETAKHVKNTLDDPEFFKNIIKKYGDWINSIYERCAARTMKKDASEADKESKKMLREKVPGLMDATGKDRSKCILFLAEGLCQEMSTRVKTVVGDEVVDVTLADIKVGDKVITHLGNIKEVISKTTKVAEVMKITTSVGEIEATPEHRYLVFNTKTQVMEYVAVRDLDKEIHKLVKHA